MTYGSRVRLIWRRGRGSEAEWDKKIGPLFSVFRKGAKDRGQEVPPHTESDKKVIPIFLPNSEQEDCGATSAFQPGHF